MRRRSTFAAPPADETREAASRRRAWRHRRKGDERKAMVELRGAAHENEHDPRLWTLYGMQCARIGRRDVARQALAHAAWLRDRAGETAKATVTRALIAQYVDNEAA